MSLLFLLAAAGAGYLAWVWGPLYVSHYEVKQVVNDFINQAVKNHHDEELRQAMCEKLASLEKERTVDAYGRTELVPVIQVDPRDVTWERDDDAKTLHVAFQYERQVVYPFLDRTAVKTFSIDRTGDISLPDWGPAR